VGPAAGVCEGQLPLIAPRSPTWTHTLSLALSFPSCLSLRVFSSIHLWAGSLGICIKTQIKGIVLFLTYKYTLLILTPTVPSPVLTSGEPLALWAFVSRPKTATAGEGGKLLESRFLLCLGDPAAGERAEGEDVGGCVDVLGKALCTCVFIWCLSLVANNRLMKRAVVGGREESRVVLTHASRRAV